MAGTYARYQDPFLGGGGGGGSPTGPAGGDLAGTYPNPTVATVGGSTAASIHTSQLLTAAATSSNTPNTLALRDGAGSFAMQALTLGSNSPFTLSQGAGSGVDNIVVGNNAPGGAMTTGFRNILMGNAAGASLTTGQENFYLGWLSGNAATISQSDVAIGAQSLRFATGVGSNTALGSFAGSALTTGSFNVIIGASTQVSSAAATGEIAIGTHGSVDASIWISNAGDTVSIGGNSLSGFPTTAATVAIGQNAGSALSSGNRHVFIGTDTGKLMTGGQGSVYMGWLAGSTAVTNSEDVAVGDQALRHATGDHNTAVGSFAGQPLTSGVYNAFFSFASGNAILTGVGNTCLGTFADATGDFSNAMALGFQATVTASNTVQIGNGSVTNVNTSGNLNTAGHLGVGNSAAATTPGTVVKKIEIFDNTGTSLGFIAVYNAIT